MQSIHYCQVLHTGTARPIATGSSFPRDYRNINMSIANRSGPPQSHAPSFFPPCLKGLSSLQAWSGAPRTEMSTWLHMNNKRAAKTDPALHTEATYSLKCRRSASIEACSIIIYVKTAACNKVSPTGCSPCTVLKSTLVLNEHPNSRPACTKSQQALPLVVTKKRVEGVNPSQ